MLELTQKIRIQATDLSVTLSYEQRSKSRLRADLDQGGEVGIFLPRGDVLNHGDCLADRHGRAVMVIAAPEILSEVRCRDAWQLARACYHLGNRHVLLQILPECVRYPQDSVLDGMLHNLGLEVTRVQMPFEPEAGAYHGHRHHAE